MRFHGIALLASATILGACGGEKHPLPTPPRRRNAGACGHDHPER